MLAQLGDNAHDISSVNLDGVDLRESLSQDLPVGGRLKYFWRRWKHIGASRRVVRWLRLGYPLRFNQKVVSIKGLPKLSLRAPPGLVTSYKDPSKQTALLQMVNQLVQKKCVRKMSPTEQGFFSRVFLVPKRSGGWRLVIDLSVLNGFLSEVSFEMDTLAKVKAATQQGMWATSLDLSDAYHHIPIQEEHQDYTVFPSGRRMLQLSGTPVRPIRSSVGVYGSNETAQEVDNSDDDAVIPVPGRLVNCSPLVPPVSNHDGQVSATSDDVRTTSQSREVRIGADTVDHISGGKAGFCMRSSLHHSPKGDIDRGEDHHGNGSAGSSIPSGRVAIGLTHVRLSDNTAGTSTPALLADGSHQGDQARPASAVLGEISASRSGAPAVVAQEGFASTRHAVSTSPSTSDYSRMRRRRAGASLSRDRRGRASGNAKTATSTGSNFEQSCSPCNCYNSG